MEDQPTTPPTDPPANAAASPAPDTNGRPNLGVVKGSKAKGVPAMPPTPVTTTPPPAFGAATPGLPTTSPAPASVVGRRRAARGAPQAGIGPDRLPEPYRSMCPAELRGEPMMEWYFAVQAGERLVLERAQTIEGISAQLGDQGEMLGDIIKLIEYLGRGLAKVEDAVKRLSTTPLTAASPAPALEPDPFVPSPPARRPAPAPPPVAPSTAEDAPYEPAPAAAADPMPVMLSRTPAGPARLTNKDAAAIREYARSLVPIAGIPWASDHQIALAAEVAEECLSQWAGPGKTAPSRWPDYIRSALIDRLGIDKARGD